MEFKILNQTVEADLFNPDVMAAFEDSITKAVDAVQEKVDSEKASESIRRQCQAVIECIDEVFGEGSAHKVLGDKTNLLICLDAFEDICFIHEQMAGMIQEKARKVNTRLAKYSAARIKKK